MYVASENILIAIQYNWIVHHNAKLNLRKYIKYNYTN